ncbi:hypothetical protein C0989_007279 [Termitomyces sp. Mn162]|nr:hypothetical protein C0989_007279 [Termitomyces sp. Mn162]
MQGLPRAQSHWRFENVILGLYDWFVQSLTMQDACSTFYNAVYAVEEGVQGFYDALLNHAQNMAVLPNEFTIGEQFLEEIPSDMLVALIHDGRLAIEVNTVEEFVLETKAYKNSIKTAAHYLECSKKSWSVWQLLLAAAQSSGPARLAPQVFVQAAHTAALSDVGEADNEQEKEPAEADVKDALEFKGTQEHGEEYVELETYDNKYYTCSSDSEGLFALREVPTSEHREKEPSNKVCMQKVWLVASKDTIDCPVLLAQDKECLVTWIEVNSHWA